MFVVASWGTDRTQQVKRVAHFYVFVPSRGGQIVKAACGTSTTAESNVVDAGKRRCKLCQESVEALRYDDPVYISRGLLEEIRSATEFRNDTTLSQINERLGKVLSD